MGQVAGNKLYSGLYISYGVVYYKGMSKRRKGRKATKKIVWGIVKILC